MRRSALSRAFTANRDVVVELGRLTNADPSLFVDLAVLAQRLRQSGHTLRLLDTPNHLRKMVQVMGIPRMPAIEVTPV